MSHAESAAAHAEPSQHIEQRWRTAFEGSAIGITMADFVGRFFAAEQRLPEYVGLYGICRRHQDVTVEACFVWMISVRWFSRNLLGPF
jgi:hypothetical protein